MEFGPGAGLWFLAVFHDEAAEREWRQPLEFCFRLLADSGFGGGRSAGWGRSESPLLTAGRMPALLSPSLAETPAPAEDGSEAAPAEMPAEGEEAPATYWLLSLFRPGARDAIEYFNAAGHQQSAYHYGSAFSRSARAATPAGKTVYVSGTAAIDEQGRTCHVGDARAQIEMTLANARAVLANMDCRDDDVVHAIAYSKTPAVEAVFRELRRDLTWPCVSVLGDICRDELLFEIEATACPGAQPG